MTDTPPESLYCLQMQEIIQRDALIRNILASKISLGSEHFDYEVFALNIRKILELIAFSSLIATKEQYALKHKKFYEHYKAKGILNDIEKIHPHFFPKPGHIEDKEDGTKFIKPPQHGKNALTREEFEELYDKCTSIIHAWKPYSQKPKEVNFRLSPLEWLNKIRDLLKIHYVHLPNEKGIWLCQMCDPQDNRPHVYTLKALEKEKS